MVVQGASQTFTMTPATNYHIASILVDGVSQGAVGTYTFTNVTASHAIAVTFAINTFTITATAGANGTIAPGTEIVNAGTNHTFTITPAANYHITGVLVDNVSAGTGGTYTFTNVLADHTISATFAINTFTITVTQGANGTITPGTETVNAATNDTFRIAANTNYHIANVIADGTSLGAVATHVFPNVTGNHSISATFTINSYTVTFDKNDAAAIGTMGVQTIQSGSTAALTTNGFSKTGWAFAGWATTSAGAVAYANGANYTMGTANVTLYAKWSANIDTIAFDKNDASATGNMPVQSIASGSSANLNANGFTKAGWTFAGGRQRLRERWHTEMVQIM